MCESLPAQFSFLKNIRCGIFGHQLRRKEQQVILLLLSVRELWATRTTGAHCVTAHTSATKSLRTYTYDTKALHTYIYIYTHRHIYTHPHAHIHTRTHTHIHTRCLPVRTWRQAWAEPVAPILSMCKGLYAGATAAVIPCVKCVISRLPTGNNTCWTIANASPFSFFPGTTAHRYSCICQH